MGIYSYELYTKYDVERIIRIGSAGALSDDIALMDIVAAIGTCTDSNYASQYGLPGTFAPTADFGLLKITDRIAQEKNLSLKDWKYCVFRTFFIMKTTVSMTAGRR